MEETVHPEVSVTFLSENPGLQYVSEDNQSLYVVLYDLSCIHDNVSNTHDYTKMAFCALVFTTF